MRHFDKVVAEEHEGDNFIVVGSYMSSMQKKILEKSSFLLGPRIEMTSLNDANGRYDLDKVLSYL